MAGVKQPQIKESFTALRAFARFVFMDRASLSSINTVMIKEAILNDPYEEP